MHEKREPFLLVVCGNPFFVAHTHNTVAARSVIRWVPIVKMLLNGFVTK
jgi:hypothetical protein